MIKAEIICDSVAAATGKRVTTFLLTYPRMVHAELMTHRVFSRNASSSRAIPVKTLLAEVLNNPAHPIYWGANQSGMQARAELEGWKLALAKQLWFKGRYLAYGLAWTLNWAGLHKQIANRVLEPWGHITVVVTATEYQNWFALRTHPDAQPEIRELALIMKDLYDNGSPKELKSGDWHLPFVRDEELTKYGIELCIKISVARCARTSYLTHDRKETTPEADVSLAVRLIGSIPMHASPAEHQCTPDELTPIGWASKKLHGNLNGFIQYRKLLPGENQGENF